MKLIFAATTLLVVAISLEAASGSPVGANSRDDSSSNSNLQQALLRGSNGILDKQSEEPSLKITRRARKLQIINLREKPFVLAGIPLIPDVAQQNCPSEWAAFATCTITRCSNVELVCPNSVFHRETSTSAISDGTYTQSVSTVRPNPCDIIFLNHSNFLFNIL